MFRYSTIACLACAVLGAHAAAAEPARLNVLFIATDDLNCKVAPYGADQVKTPNLDRLSARAVQFNRAFCQYPVCNASRTSVLSGLYPEATEVYSNGQHPRRALPTRVFLPEMFKQQGYFIAGIGKIAHGSFPDAVAWDVVADAAHGEEGEGGSPTGGAAKQRKNKKGVARPKAKSKSKAANTDAVPYGWQATENSDQDEPDGRTATQVIQLLEEHQADPFFIAAGFHRPHVPHTAPKSYFSLYPEASMSLAPRGGDAVPKLAYSHFHPDLSEAAQRAVIAHYSAATSYMDSQLGVLLDTMDRLNLWDNTVVIFWSDHGWHHGEHGGIWSKFTLLDESARVPLLVAAPGGKPGHSQGIVELIDMYPTLAELCQLTPPDDLQGQSFAPLLHDPSLPGKPAAYTVIERGAGRLARGVRTKDFTYLEYPDGTAQLFAADDVGEMDNLIDDSARASDLAAMKSLLAETAARAAR